MECAESALYLAGHRELLTHAFSRVKDYAIRSLQQAAANTLATTTITGSLTDLDEASAYYVKFRSAAPSLHAVNSLIESHSSYEMFVFALMRVSRIWTRSTDRFKWFNRFESMVLECHQSYYEQRMAVLTPVVTKCVEAICARGDLIESVRK